VQLVVFAEPLGIYGIGERGAGTVQRGLRYDRQCECKTCQYQQDMMSETCH